MFRLALLAVMFSTALAGHTPNILAITNRVAVSYKNNATTTYNYLTDGNGRALYIYTPDVQFSGVSTCTLTGNCALVWPPLFLASGGTNINTGTGTTASLISTIIRNDTGVIRHQVAYNGYPLYYYYKDALPGDVRGVAVGNRWFLIGPDGRWILNSLPITSNSTVAGTVHPTPPQPTVLTTPATNPSLAVTSTINIFFADHVVDGAGFTLYNFLIDVRSSQTSACYAANSSCSTTWPPVTGGSANFVTVNNTLFLNDQTTASTLQPSLLTYFNRTDQLGEQVAYGGWPLYYFKFDSLSSPGTINGQGSGSVWYLVGASGNTITDIVNYSGVQYTPASVGGVATTTPAAGGGGSGGGTTTSAAGGGGSGGGTTTVGVHTTTPVVKSGAVRLSAIPVTFSVLVSLISATLFLCW